MKEIAFYSHLMIYTVFALGVTPIFPSVVFADAALDRERQALNIISDFADQFCKDIPLKGAKDRSELSGQAKAELGGIVKKLANLGVEGAGKYQNSEYQGLLQNDLLEALKANVNCRLKIWSDLSSTLLKKTPDSVDTTQEIKIAKTQQTSKFTRSSCGSITDHTRNLEWFVGPNETMTWYEAHEWARNLSACDSSWRMPSSGEIATLYDPEHVAGIGYFAVGKNFPNGRRFPAKIHPIFYGIGDGSWVWASNSPSKGKAKAFNLNQNIPTEIDPLNRQLTTRAFAVRSLR